MNPLFLAFTLAGAVSVSAENRVLKTLSVKPTRLVEGPLVSVIIPAYNEERYLPALLRALENQTYAPIEVTVVDNNSDDSTVEIAKSVGADVVTNVEQCNIALSRNMGVEVSHGDILIFIDADSVPESNAIEKSVTELLKGYDLVYTNHCCTDSHIQSLMRVCAGWLDPSTMSVNGMFLCVTRKAFNSVSGFDETIIAGEGKGEDREFVNALIKIGANITMLKNVYVGTSARRQKKEGYIVKQHFQSRSIRGIGKRQYNTVQQLS